MTTLRVTAAPVLDLRERVEVLRNVARLEPKETGLLRVPLADGDLAASLEWSLDQAFYWASAGQCRVGLGVARTATGHGPTRLEQVRRTARRIDGGARRCGTAAVETPRSLRWHGGLSFRPTERAAGDRRAPWDSFPDAEFVVPRWLLVAEGGRRWAECAVRGEDVRSEGPERVLAVLQEEHREIERRLGAKAPAGEPIRGSWRDPHASRTAWRGSVRELLAEIATGAVDKVVPARSIEVDLEGRPELAVLIRRLEAARNSVVTFCFLKQGAAFLGATPERLVRLEGRSVSCHALAGSEGLCGPVSRHGRRVEVEAAASRLRQRLKDQTEHAWVTRHLVERLRPLCSVLDVPPAPRILDLPGVLHLESPIHGELASPLHVLELTRRLHPTPAVAGAPVAAALEWIRRHERFPRGWYAGPIGWFESGGDGDLRVALRSFLVADTKAYLFAGAGVVDGSDPEAELAEIDVKLEPARVALLGAR